MAEYTKAVKEFLTRTNSHHKIYFFSVEEDWEEEEEEDWEEEEEEEEEEEDWDAYEPIDNHEFSLYVWEVAQEFTLSGGKLKNLDVDQLAEKYAKMNGWKIFEAHVVDQSDADKFWGRFKGEMD